VSDAHDASATTDPLLAVEDLSVSLGGSEVLSHVTASATRGRFVGLVGPNGAGKTTLLRAVTGALTPDSGRVRIDGQVVAELPSKAASRLVASVPQDTSLSFDFDVRETVAMGRTPYVSRFGRRTQEDREIVESAMVRTDVAQFAERSITEISGGERQRVLLARALAQDTPLLLLDEPTASLDISHQIRTLELVRDLVADGRTVVAAIHDLNLAAHYCDELWLLGDGDLLATGNPASVLTEERLSTAFDADALVTRHPVTGSTYVTALPTSRGDAEGRVHVIGGGGSAARVLYLLSSAGYHVTCGALNEGDSDTETARQLGIDPITVDPFAPVDAGAREAVADAVAAADAVVVADVEVGDGNLANLEAARSADRVVLVEDRPFSERNFAGDRARRLYDALRERGTVVESRDLLGAVAEQVGGVGEVEEVGETGTAVSDHDATDERRESAETADSLSDYADD
jgi:iron complex transport system ATP-binding protein